MVPHKFKVAFWEKRNGKSAKLWGRNVERLFFFKARRRLVGEVFTEKERSEVSNGFILCKQF